MLSGRVLQPVLRGMNIWTKFQGVSIAQEKYDSLYRLPVEQTAQLKAAPASVSSIRFDDVTLKYDTSDVPVFRHLSAEIEPGEMVGIVGANDTGKSSLFFMILGLVKPTEGAVFAGGHNIATLDLPLLRERIGYVPQSGTFFNGTVLENLTLFREGETKRSAMHALERVGLADFIARLPKGLDTRLGDAAPQGFPATIAQRLLLARALASDPDVLLLDNPDAGMDSLDDAALRQILESIKGTKTIILASHRPSLLRLCDRRLAIRDRTLISISDSSAGAAHPVSALPHSHRHGRLERSA
jgi:ATP-binding cassette subfamily C protein LapB